jgi:hypothetical protein
MAGGHHYMVSVCVITHIGEGSLLVVQTQFLVIKLGFFENLC